MAGASWAARDAEEEGEKGKEMEACAALGTG